MDDLPPCPPLISERQYLQFVVDVLCTHCGGGGPQFRFYETFTRVCFNCFANEEFKIQSCLMKGTLYPDLALEDYVPHIYLPASLNGEHSDGLTLVPTEALNEFATYFNNRHTEATRQWFCNYVRSRHPHAEDSAHQGERKDCRPEEAMEKGE
ncbi:hypothetical protein GLOTRDRAFT_93635 [Gloeophyllum trabeum ATCC 11539]|uniref:Uncharacterized protein n=1 Tax=Gloeophyllum trabeum (strain ATCC 11539 / FP-39264 / Madison 617) TaxID=670483 RepID=S7Q6N3_GLOTA|nr:uncharacterized protein GLOTRDRAFT_93635 [Gloeophyllum trabeum ATCC 11539]EPQ55088.1 hypothetical protein GLOTRDRAFT_93635 [Gloeophyllum trabeum ATCC 11539]